MISIRYFVSQYVLKDHHVTPGLFNDNFWINSRGKVGEIAYTFQSGEYMRSVSIQDFLPIANLPPGVKIMFNSENVYHITVSSSPHIESIICESWAELLEEIRGLENRI